MFAVVDIETTGGSPEEAGITEVCVVLTDGIRVEQIYETLLNPGVQVPASITALTGISNAMLTEAPVFASVAAELYHLLHDRVFVAHNVQFDYSFLRAAFKKAGYAFTPQKLCTVKLSRKAFPGHRSYSLGNICQSVGIPIENRHRAGGDALATSELLQKCIELLGMPALLDMVKRSRKQIVLPPGIDPKLTETLPARPGVYYFLNRAGIPLYIGKATNLQRRVLQHFDTTRGKTALQLEQIAHIDYEETGNELMALLTEAEQIQKHWPAWNVSGKSLPLQYTIVSYTTQGGEMRLQTLRRRRGNRLGTAFPRLSDARNTLGKLLHTFNICEFLSRAGSPCQDPECYCHEEATVRMAIHNSRILQALDSLEQTGHSCVIQGPGRHSQEQALVYIQNGKVSGWSFAEEISPDTLQTPPARVHPDLPETRAIASAFLRKIESGLLSDYTVHYPSVQADTSPDEELNTPARRNTRKKTIPR
ncbi:MAG: GIY-YIG nuclease family protein [Bacteroidetes bacterium]|nr:GIY-YIG nuclease family protein [Bacteroidota bacterium]